MPILVRKSPRRSCRIETCNNRIGANGFLNRRCAYATARKVRLRFPYVRGRAAALDCRRLTSKAPPQKGEDHGGANVRSSQGEFTLEEFKDLLMREGG